MTPAANVGGSERLRLFCALRLPAPTVDRLAAWQGQELTGIDGVRPTPTEHLHITVAFLGSRPAADVEGVAAAVRQSAKEAGRPMLRVASYRETPRVAMVVLAEDEPRHAHVLAGRLMLRLEELGVYRREYRSWLAHVTVARFRSRPRLSPPLPELGPVCPSELALYHSLLRPAGAQYEVLESVALDA